MATRFSCGLDGTCQEDPQGRYRSREGCQRECRAAEAKVLQYLIYGYTPEEARGLAPRDRIEIIRQVTGVIVDADSSYNILLGLGREDLHLLARYPILYDYLLEHYDWDYPLVDALIDSGTPEATRLLLERDELNERRIGRLVRASDFAPDVISLIAAHELNAVISLLRYEAPSNPTAFQQLHVYNHPIDIQQLGIPQNVAVLNLLVDLGYEDNLAPLLPQIYTKDHPRPVVRWFLQRYPNLRTAYNVALSLAHGARNFVLEVKGLPAFGREVLRILVNELSIYPDELPYPDDPDYADPLNSVLERIDRLKQVVTLFNLRYEEFLSAARSVWDDYLLGILKEGDYRWWINTLKYLEEKKPDWTSIARDLAMYQQRPEATNDILIETFQQWDDLTAFEGELVINFLQYYVIPLRLFLLHRPELLIEVPYLPTTEEEIRSFLPEIKEGQALFWLEEHYPALTASYSLFQTVLLQDLGRPSLRVRNLRRRAYLPEELITPPESEYEESDEDYERERYSP